MNIENSLRPSTVNEILLVNRINEIKREMYGMRSVDYIYDCTDLYLNEIRLPLIAEVEAIPCDYTDQLSIVGRSVKGPKIGFRHFAALTPDKDQNIHILESLHKKLIHQLAAEWSK